MMRLLQKLKGRLSEPADRVHLNVFRYHLATYRQPDVHARAMARAARRLNLSVSELAAGDHAALDEITSIDEWRIGKEWSLKLLGEGWRCYLARHDGHIVSIIWTIVGKTFRDDRLERTLTLAPDEAYFGRGFTIPEFRGRGVISVLGAHAIRDLTDSGVRQGTALVRATNRAMGNTLLGLGGDRAGVLGYIGVFGARLHYLFGKDALTATRPRVYLDLRRYSKQSGAVATYE